MYTATVQITINQFAPISYARGTTIDATLSAPKNTSATGSGGSKVFSGNGQSITVKVPKGYTGAVQITFQLPDPNNVLVGIAVGPTTTPTGASYGRREFRTVTINRDASGSQMTITDACVPSLSQVDYTYVILVQNVSGPNAGKIGIIDPDIETEVEN